MVEKQMAIINQQTLVTTLDLQLYAIARQVQLQNWCGLGHHVFRLGGFLHHTAVLENLLE